MRNTNLGFRRKKMNKRGSLEFIIVAIVLLILGLSWFFIQYTSNSITTDLTADDTLTADGKAMLINNGVSMNQVWDYGFGFIFFGLLLEIIVSSYFIDTHPAFFVAGLILFTFVVFVGANITNVFDDTISDSDFLALNNNFPVMIFIMDNLVMELIVGFVFMSIVLYGKSRSGY